MRISGLKYYRSLQPWGNVTLHTLIASYFLQGLSLLLLAAYIIYNLDLDLVQQVPYHRVVACELLKLANRKPTCHFRSLKHVVGKKTVNVKLRRLVSRAFFRECISTQQRGLKYRDPPDHHMHRSDASANVSVKLLKLGCFYGVVLRP